MEHVAAGPCCGVGPPGTGQVLPFALVPGFLGSEIPGDSAFCVRAPGCLGGAGTGACGGAQPQPYSETGWRAILAYLTCSRLRSSHSLP